MLIATLLLAVAALPEDPEVGTARAVPAVVRCADGRVLRGRVIARADGVRVEVGGRTVFVPVADVAAVDVERDLLAELTKLDGKGDALASAGWALGAGLFPEGLARLDRVLASEPGDRRALALLDTYRAALRPAVPGLAELRAAERASADASAEQRAEWIERAVASGSQAGAAARECIAAELVALCDAEELAAPIAAGLRRPEGTRRAFAATLHRRGGSSEHARALLAQALLDPSDGARASAALAIGAQGDERAIAVLIEALGRPHGKLSLHAAEALGLAGHPAAIAPLAHALLQSSSGVSRAPRGHVFAGTQRAYVGDFDVEVALGQAIANPVVMVAQEGAVLDVAVQSVDVAPSTRARALRTAIRRLSGSDPGSTRSAQERWWAAYQADAREPRATPSDGTGGA